MRIASSFLAILGLFMVVGVSTAATHTIEPTAQQLQAFADEHAKAIGRIKRSIDDRKATIKKYETSKVPPITTGEDRKARQLKATQARLKAIQSYKRLLAEDEAQLKVLEAGLMLRSTPRLFLVSLDGLQVPAVGRFGLLSNVRTTISQIVGDEEMLVRVGDHPSIVVTMRVPTAGLVDDVQIKFDESRVFVVSGTHRFTTVGGSTSTVLLIEEINMDTVRAFIKQRAN
ncbi:MAG: hypothetical protein WD063_11945 [Pirellulales bacterium]